MDKIISCSSSASTFLQYCVDTCLEHHCHDVAVFWRTQLQHSFMSCPSQTSSALASRSCCRGSLTCIPPELGDASPSGAVAGCQCRQPSGQSSCPVQSVTMSLTAAATSPSAWAAPTRCVRPAYTNCTARPAPSIRPQSAPISTCCRSTVPCCSWLELRWVRKTEAMFMSKRFPASVSRCLVCLRCAHDVCLLGPRCAAGEPEQCSRSGELWGLQGVLGRAGSLPKTYQRSKRFACLSVQLCMCVFDGESYSFRSAEIWAKERSSLYWMCGGHGWAACATWQSCFSHSHSWRLKAAVLLWFWRKITQ